MNWLSLMPLVEEAGGGKNLSLPIALGVLALVLLLRGRPGGK